MNKFRELGFIRYDGGLEVHSSLLNVVLPDLCTEFGLAGDCLLNFGPPRFCQIAFGTSTEYLLL
jgi:hypothetical protein